MKYKTKKILALFTALVFAIPSCTFAEDSVDEFVIIGETSEETGDYSLPVSGENEPNITLEGDDRIDSFDFEPTAAELEDNPDETPEDASPDVFEELIEDMADDMPEYMTEDMELYASETFEEEFAEDAVGELTEEFMEDAVGELTEEFMEDATEDQLIEEETEGSSEQTTVMADEPQITTWDELQAALDEGGTVTLTQDITAGKDDAELIVAREVILDLNGCVLRKTRTIIQINAGGSLTLKDSDPEKVHASLTYKDPMDGTVFELSGGVIYKGCISVEGGNLTMEGGMIAGSDLGAVQVLGGSFVMSGGTVAGTGRTYEGVENDSDGTIYSGSITILGTNSTFTMHGGCITCSRCTGVCVGDGAAFIMKDGCITKNNSYNYGGGTYVNSGIFNMEGGKISENKALMEGGGVYLIDTTFDMLGGSITNNIADCGGGVAATSSIEWSVSLLGNADPDHYSDAQFDIPIMGFFYMEGGIIAGNATTGDSNQIPFNGGGIYLHDAVHFEMSGNACVMDNTAGNEGGGIFVRQDKLSIVGLSDYGIDMVCVPKEIILTGGIIQGNIAGHKGGGMWMSQLNTPAPVPGYPVLIPPKSMFAISGNTVITGNYSGSDTVLSADNLCLMEDAFVTVSGPLAGATIGVNTEMKPTETEPVVFTSGLAGNGVATNFISDDPAYGVKLNTGGEAVLGVFTYDISIADFQNGSVTYADDSMSSSEIVPGTLIPLTVKAEPGYELDSLTYTGADGLPKEITPDEDGGYSFVMPAADTTVTAAFSLAPVASTLSAQPQDLSLTYGYAEGGKLSVAAEEAAGHTLSYQWYSNTIQSSEGGGQIDGATEADYAIPAGLAAGTFYYYCVVTATRADNGKTAETISKAAKVTVAPKELTVTADALSKTCGDPDPKFTYKVTGLLGSDQLTGNLSREAGEEAGTYAILQGTLKPGSANYTLTYKDASLTILKKAEPETGTKETEPEPGTKETEPENDEEKADAVVLSKKDDKDLENSTFCLLRVKAKKVTGSAITIAWKKVPGAASYTVYGNKCGRKNRYRKLATVTGTSFTYKKLKKGTYYKFVVAANRTGKERIVSKTLHVATTGGKVGNSKSVRITSKKNVTLKKGKTTKIKAKAVAKSSKLKVKKHRKLAFETDNPKVATVDKKGKVKAVGAGKCTIYVYAQDGVFAKVKVKVK